LGVSISQATVQAVLKTRLIETIQGPDAEKYIDIARRSVSEMWTLLPPDVLELAVSAYTDALRAGFTVCVICGSISFVASLWMQKHRLSQTTSRQDVDNDGNGPTEDEERSSLLRNAGSSFE
jgi:hypothetical protein